MAQQQSSAIAETWQQWEGRVVNGRYPLGQYLGGTEQSAVYSTNNTGSRAAIKLIPANASEAQAQLSRWELAARLSHPNMLRILEVGRWHADDEQDMLFAVMDFADENLAETRRALTAAETRQMLEPTLDGLRYLHAQGIVHGRLRPANVMAVNEQLKLSSDSVRHMGKTDPVVARSDIYEAPERASGLLAPSGDIWSLGVMLVHALTNRVPEFDGQQQIKVPENLPAPLDQVVKHCLNRDPEQRWSATEIKKYLDRPVPEAPPKSTESLKTPGKEEKSVVAVSQRPIAPLAAVKKQTSSDIPTRHPTAVRSILADRRKVVIAAALICALIAILVGLRLGRSRSEVPLPSTATAGQPTTAAVAHSAPPATVGSNEAQAAVRHQVLPEISRRARSSISGTVKVRVKVAVDPSGKVSHAALTARGPSTYFARQALEAARRWTFVPPQVHGQPAGSEWALNFEFRQSGTKAAAQRVS